MLATRRIFTVMRPARAEEREVTPLLSAGVTGI
jgi:hypothetical protein